MKKSISKKISHLIYYSITQNKYIESLKMQIHLLFSFHASKSKKLKKIKKNCFEVKKLKAVVKYSLQRKQYQEKNMLLSYVNFFYLFLRIILNEVIH
jgi:hypothetical protein